MEGTGYIDDARCGKIASEALKASTYQQLLFADDEEAELTRQCLHAAPSAQAAGILASAP